MRVDTCERTPMIETASTPRIENAARGAVSVPDLEGKDGHPVVGFESVATALLGVHLLGTVLDM